MKNLLKYTVFTMLLMAVSTGCINYRKLLTDEVVLKDGNTHTGTILKSDSSAIKLEKIDESISIIPWFAIDTIQGKKLKTFWIGGNIGYYKTPYFSVFRNEPITSRHWGMEYKAGLAYRGVRMYYLALTLSPAHPYAITKFGFGYQRYLGKTTYMTKTSFFIGTEVNMMNVKYNNGSQLTFEPFTGFEKKCNDRLRVHLKLGFQANVSNKNKEMGVNITVGVHFMKKNLRKQYETLNKEHKLIRK